MEYMEQQMDNLIQSGIELQNEIYEAGFDAGLNGANAKNSHFSFFSSKGKMEVWSKGKADGEKSKTDR